MPYKVEDTRATRGRVQRGEEEHAADARDDTPKGKVPFAPVLKEKRSFWVNSLPNRGTA